MANCGWGACAASKESCGGAIASMVLDTLSGLMDMVTTITTFGAGTAAKKAATTGAKAAVKKLG